MKSLTEAADAIRTGQLTAASLVDTCLARIAAANAKLTAFVHLDLDAARTQARAIDARVARGEDPGPLAGVPFGVKDMRETVAGMPRREGSVFNRDNAIDAHDSVFIARLRAACAIPLGKVATAEYGMDGVTHTVLHGTTRNPWNLERTPAGSSGGSSAAVAAGLVPFCTASDGGGSTRCPAGYTGTVGLKPSHGRLPRVDGFNERAQNGVITTTVADTARILDVASGPDDGDRMTLPPPGMRYEQAIESLDVAGLKCVYTPDFGFAPVEPEIVELTRKAAQALARAARLAWVEREVRFTNVYMSTNMLMTRLFCDVLERDGILPGRLHEMSPGPQWFVRQARGFTPAQMIEAREKEKRLEREVADFFAGADILFSPCHSRDAYAAEGPLPETVAGRDSSQTHAEPFTMLANICWNPSISVPAGLTAAGLPVGLLITVRRHRDDLALRLARLLEQAAPWPRIAPGW